MINYMTGDMFQTKAEYLVIPVNTVGIAGAGVAKQWADAEPELLARYKALCGTGTFHPSEIVVYDGIALPYRKYILLATKEHWRNPSQIEWITTGLVRLNHFMIERNHPSVALPKIGCGRGGLNWGLVRRYVNMFLNNALHNVEVYE